MAGFPVGAPSTVKPMLAVLKIMLAATAATIISCFGFTRAARKLCGFSIFGTATGA
jgi:hypothetical protein